MIRGRSIICFGGEDWWYHHPHANNHLMKRFARENRVIFINSISMGLPGPGSPEFFTKIRRKLKSFARYLRRTPEGIWVITPFLTPFFSNPFWRSVNRALLWFQIRTLCLFLGVQTPILWIAIPTARDWVGAFGESSVLYHVTDRYDANTIDNAGQGGLIRRLHLELVELADLVFYHGKKLFEEAEAGPEKAVLFEQAVDFEHFSAVTDREWPCPDSLRLITSSRKPVLGYFGSIERWLIDQPLVRQVAEARPDWQFVFIGLKSAPMDIEDLPNVHFLKSVPYEDLPAYAAQFDVCVLPWDKDHEVVKYGSATKVREYLATGKPVVIVPMPEFEPFRDVLTIADSPEAFMAAVEASLTADTPEAMKARRDSVLGKTWDARFVEVSDRIAGCEAEKWQP